MLYSPTNSLLSKRLTKYDKDKKIVFISQASLNMCWARHLCHFVINEGYVPVNYFTVFANFVHEIAPLQVMIDCINTLIVRCDYLWVFGEISEGMWFEIKMCKDIGIPIKYFDIGCLPEKIKEINEIETKYTPKFSEIMLTDKHFCPVQKIK